MSAAAAMPDPVDEAVRRVAAGSLVAYATETVWGLGADARSAAAVDRLRRWKGRDADRALSVLVTGIAAADALGACVSDAARVLARVFWPGPLTLVLPVERDRFAPGVARGDGAVGFRCSPHPVAAALARRLEVSGVGPVTATSLNRSGRPPARDRAEALQACGHAISSQRLEPSNVAADRPRGGHAGTSEPWLLDGAGPDAGGSAPSTLVDLTGPSPQILREGPVGADALEAALAAGGVRRT